MRIAKIEYSENLICPICNRLFQDYISNERRYCSRNCYKIGFKYSYEIHQKIAKTLTGKKLKGIQREKAIKNCKMRSGAKSNFWRDGRWKDKNHRKNVRRKYNKLRKALKRASGELHLKTIQLIYEDNIKKYGTLTCYLCLKFIEFGNDHLEHKIPISRGGTNIYNNLAVACRKCNLEKANRTEQEFKIIQSKKLNATIR